MAPSSEEYPKLEVSFSISRSPKLMFSITINQLVHYGCMGMENVSLVERDMENDTNNFRYSSLEGAVINWMMKCDG